MSRRAVATDHAVTAFRWEDRDGLQAWSITALVGALAFVALGVFGLPRADLHSPFHQAGIMDPLCGMTRAMRLLAVGDFAAAWKYNPGSYVVAAFGAVFNVRYWFGVMSGKWPTVTLFSRRLAILIVIVGVAVLWINQQANADLLMTRGLR